MSDTPLFDDTVVRLYDCQNVWVATWLGYILPDWIGNILGKYDNLNAAFLYTLEWSEDGGTKKISLPPGNLPLTIQDYLIRNAYLR